MSIFCLCLLNQTGTSLDYPHFQGLLGVKRGTVGDPYGGCRKLVVFTPVGKGSLAKVLTHQLYDMCSGLSKGFEVGQCMAVVYAIFRRGFPIKWHGFRTALVWVSPNKEPYLSTYSGGNEQGVTASHDIHLVVASTSPSHSASRLHPSPQLLWVLPWIAPMSSG